MKAFYYSRRGALALAIAAATVAITPVGARSGAPADAIVGQWEADDGGVRLSWFKEGTEYRARFLYGKLSANPDGTMKKDLNNPDPALRSRSLKNIVLATGMRFENGQWSGGTIYDGASGKTFKCIATMDGPKLKLAAYVNDPAQAQARLFHRIP